jgi:hypothetical protein
MSYIVPTTSNEFTMARYLAHTYLIENIENILKNISILKNQTIDEIKNLLKIFSDGE